MRQNRVIVKWIAWANQVGRKLAVYDSKHSAHAMQKNQQIVNRNMAWQAADCSEWMKLYPTQSPDG